MAGAGTAAFSCVCVCVVSSCLSALAPAVPASAAPSRGTPSLATVVLPALGPGYAVVGQGPLDPATFAANAPDPNAAARALGTLSSSIATYQRTWQDPSLANEVQDLVVRFPSPAAAEVFLRSAEHSFDTGEIVSSGPLTSVPGARRVTYFGTTTEPGVGQAISLRAGVYVALLSFFSGASGNPGPITPAGAARLARTQQVALTAAPGGRVVGSRGVTVSSLGWAALAVAVLAVAVATPLLLRRRRPRAKPAATPPAAAD
jgi:hypothetical protein